MVQSAMAWAAGMVGRRHRPLICWTTKCAKTVVAIQPLNALRKRCLSTLPRNDLLKGSLAAATQDGEAAPGIVVRHITSNSGYHELGMGWHYLAAAMIAVVAADERQVTSFCDAQESEEDEVEEDPYDNLPPTDEPTHCSICNTYRKGPCRPYWRKVEYCTKDHDLGKNKDESEEGVTENPSSQDEPAEKPVDEPPCIKYMLPWIDCVQGYRNLYSLIELDTNYTMGISDVEEEATLTMCWNPSCEPSVDWTEWKMHVKEHEWKPKKAGKGKPKVKDTVAAKGVPLWQTLDVDDPSKDPQLVTVKAQIERMEGDGRGVLECAFALDQGGNVIGFAYGSNGQKNEDKPKSEDSNETQDAKQPTVPKVELSIRILPTHTTHVTIGASYIQPDIEKSELSRDDSDAAKEDAVSTTTKKTSTVHLYKTRTFSLSKMAKQ